MWRWLLAILLLSLPAFAGSDLLQQEKVRHAWFVEQGLLGTNETPAHVNELIWADSPYLLSHALQPVNWREWSQQALNDAREKQQLIFLSIGYATCHWCHVMAGESFSDAGIAELLNSNFLSIKVDREQLPTVDNQYRFAMEVLKGEPGWPLNVILTPAGDIIWIDAYQSREQLQRLLSALAQRWQSKPEALTKLAKRHSLLLKQHSLGQPGDAGQWPQQVEAVQQRIMTSLAADTGPRFLHETWLLAMASDAMQGDKEQERRLFDQLDKTLASPVYDVIDGGFHRYAEDANRQQPHFEKMLYTQALMASVLAKAWSLSAEPRYKNAFWQTLAWVDQYLYTNGGYASAMSAVSSAGEGSYYRFADIEAQELVSKGFLSNSMASTGRLLWLDPLLPGWPNLSLLQQARDIRKQDPIPPIDTKVILSWNALYLNALLDAYWATGELSLAQKAEQLGKVLQQNFVTPSGLMRIGFENRTSIVAGVEDRAWFALALLQLAQLNRSRGDLGTAEKRQRYAYALLREGGWLEEVRDGELPAAAAAAYRALNLAAELAPDEGFRQQANDLAKRLAAEPAGLLSQYSLLRAVQESKPDSPKGLRTFAGGHGSIWAERLGKDIKLNVRMDDGWHINAHGAEARKLIGTEVLSPASHWILTYPEPHWRRLGFTNETLALYEGDSAILLSCKPEQICREGEILKVKLQACSDKLCLLPQTLSLWAPAS
ncbi:thioredoxin domain-containing protein [Shewanella sedimentimangrovi]|uniref:Thioredoxin domain-containing protein n=1 Tax=Shewanella sedimentimangrovi TaxID=2814293 RepID=A0ABX7QWY9_9GAMM|nr:DUF255 domain-containing protein [Shewanella sedimentimangrovi]QSX36016.1 thioredoxin domain-containing protein [Shewanella sedimentimangrovi]